jgi:RHS repeat-associated protein
VTRLTNASGTTSTYRHDAFGGIRSQTGSGNTYGFASRESETDAGLHYNRARYYDPSAGRFLGADPSGLGGGMNRYAYAADNPVKGAGGGLSPPWPSDPGYHFRWPCWPEQLQELRSNSRFHSYLESQEKDPATASGACLSFEVCSAGD